MPADSDRYDFFVSYARADNAQGWISGFIEELLAEHRCFSGGRALVPFFDTQDIRGLDDCDKPGRVVTNEGDIAFRLLALLQWKFNELQDVRAGLDAGHREQAVLEAAGIRGFRQEIVRRTLRKHSAAALRQAMEALLRANLELRASGSRQEIMERLTLALVRGT